MWNIIPKNRIEICILCGMLFCLKIFIFFSFSRRFNDDNGDRIEGVSRVGSRRNFVVNTVDGKKKEMVGENEEKMGCNVGGRKYDDDS